MHISRECYLLILTHSNHLFLDKYCFWPDYRVLSSIRREIGKQWKHVGYALGLEHSLLECTEHNHPHGVEEKAFKMLTDWIQRDVHPCYCKLIYAMDKEHLHQGVECLRFYIK